MDWADPMSLAGVLEWRGFTAGAIIAAFWIFIAALFKGTFSRRRRYADGVSPAPGAAGSSLAVPAAAAFLLGGLLFIPSISLVQVPLQQMAERWAMGTFTTANLAVTGLPGVALSGLVQEPFKAAAGLVALLFWRRRSSGWLLGAWAGLGYGAMEAWLFISAGASFLLEAGVAPASLWGPLAPALLERLVTTGFHGAITGLVFCFGAARGSAVGGAGLLAASLYHGLLNYGILLQAVGYLSPSALQVYIYVFALIPVAGLAMALRRSRGAPPEPVFFTGRQKV